jgi:hypothetical protein
LVIAAVRALGLVLSAIVSSLSAYRVCGLFRRRAGVLPADVVVGAEAGREGVAALSDSPDGGLGVVL